MSRDESKNSITDLKAQEAVGNEATHDWSKFKPSCLFSCCNFVLQLVLVGSLGSFLFGFNMALLNTATKSINSSFLQCSEPDFYLRFTYRPSGMSNHFAMRPYTSSKKEFQLLYSFVHSTIYILQNFAKSTTTALLSVTYQVHSQFAQEVGALFSVA